jgi:Sulfotransferase family
LHQWLRLFPAVKVIIALRDPRDVLVSTFFLNVRLNPTSANFLTLQRTAQHYADLMEVWLRLRELGGFDWMESRYEAVVADVAAEGRRATEFLGLPWHPEQAATHEPTDRTFVFAPTYHAVTQPVHQRAIGRWQNYAEVLAPVQAKLAPYCKAFGYA